MKISNVNNFNSFGMKYRIIDFPNVNSDFVNNIKTSLDSLPDSWQNPLEKDNYYLFCTNSIQDTFDAMNIPEKAPDLEAITCTAPHTKWRGVDNRGDRKTQADYREGRTRLVGSRERSRTRTHQNSNRRFRAIYRELQAEYPQFGSVRHQGYNLQLYARVGLDSYQPLL